MGAGKSTVGPLLADRLGLSFMDTDQVIEQRAGASIEAIFATAGEPTFRALEREVVAEALAEAPGVVALGGGALEDPGTRAALRGFRVVHLEVGFEEALRRVGGERPMLRSREPRGLFEERAELYRSVATDVVATDGRSPDQVAVAIAAAVESKEPSRAVTVDLAERSYPVHIGQGTAARAPELLPGIKDAESAFVITHPRLVELAAPLIETLRSAGLRVVTTPIPEGEESKSLATAATLYDKLAAGNIRRDDLVIALGGGVVTDLAGFVASTYYRGIGVAHFPTTLLAQVDAAIGGKTGVNLDAGKNLVGTIHQPVGVVCDVALLRTLDEAELRSGLAEVIKYGLIRSPELLDLVADNVDAILARDARVLIELVTRCVAIKAEVVSADEQDIGVRAILNYGHTFAHALEQAAGYHGMRHGEAVSIGMMAAAHVARELGRVDDSVVDRHREVLSSVGLPTSAPLDIEVLEKAWQHDKKYRKGVRFVLLRAIGDAEAGIAVPREALLKMVASMAS